MQLDIILKKVGKPVDSSILFLNIFVNVLQKVFRNVIDKTIVHFHYDSRYIIWLQCIEIPNKTSAQESDRSNIFLNNLLAFVLGYQVCK